MTPRPYQVPGIEKAVGALPKHGAYLLADETGCGKTFSAAFTAKRLGWPVAVVCPKAVIPSWRGVLDSLSVPTVFIENIERLRARKEWLRKDGKKWVWTLPRCLLICDEIHRFGSPDSQSAHILNAAPKPVLMLSATVADSPLKLRAIGSQLGLTTWNNWWSWCLKNGCKPAFFGGLEFKNPAKLAGIHEAIFTEKGSRVRKKDLPPGEFPEEQIELVPVPVDEPAKINAEYAELLTALQAESPNAAVFNLRARQLSELQKLPAIESMIGDLLEEGNSVCVFLNFSNSLEHLHAKFPDASLVFGTNTKGQTQHAEDRQAQIERFQANEARLILCMTSAGGIGISLHDLHGDHPRVSLINPNHSAVELIQALGRIHRNGAKTPCIQRLLFAADTIEEQVMKKVQKKVGNISLLSDGDLSPLSTNTP